ncbi:MAG: CYTH domain-containing protein [Muribaculaceae bacterium]|nr:CYTH domain-containing protein [Muribaculaceae bacterium]
MGLEIERKFLVKDNSYRKLAYESVVIEQGYLCREPSRTVRVRILGEHGYLTIKGVTRGTVREEYEYKIPYVDARQILDMCGDEVLSKRRWYVNYGGKCWEVDEFLGCLQGLVVAEIELGDESEEIKLPEFVGEEVTGDARYYNSMLIGASQAPQGFRKVHDGQP